MKNIIDRGQDDGPIFISPLNGAIGGGLMGWLGGLSWGFIPAVILGIFFALVGGCVESLAARYKR